MCGIAGALIQKHLDQNLTGQVGAMRDALRHRGPDDSGVWRSPSGQATLGHTRLSILDLSPAGHQPMSTPDGRFSITFNGEIYNYLELRTELEDTGVIFHTHTDTEVLLRLYERDGKKCLPRLRGMFAFAIWDELERRAFLARDRFGIKPLYYSLDAGRLVFASELRAISASGLVEKRICATAVHHFLKSGSVPEPYTLLEGVHMLEAGTLLEWQDGRSQTDHWWQIRFPPCDSMGSAEASSLLRRALIDSVEHHFISDVPVGIFLSGGLDSTALLALAKAAGRDNIQTFTVGVDKVALDESEIARQTSRHFGTIHHEIRLDAASGREIFLSFLETTDQPSIDGFNTFCVSRLASASGMKVVLSGLGGDELMAGYPSFAKLPGLVSKARMLGPLKKPLGFLLERFAQAGNLRRLGGAVHSGGSLDDLYRAFRGIFSRKEAQKLTAAIVGCEARSIASCLPLPPEQPTILEEISALELSRYMRNQLLRDSDVMSMSAGLELRVPMLDHTVFSALAKIPASLRLRQDKQLLLDAVPEIPLWVSQRKKHAFLFPYQDWLESSQWGDRFRHAGVGLPVPLVSWYQKWSIFMLKHWMEREGLKG